MTRKTVVTLGTLVVLLVSLFGTVAAQTGTTDNPTPVPTSSTTYTHPVVQILSAYFGRNLGDSTDPGTETVTPDPNDPTTADDPADPAVTPEPTEDPQQALADEIAAYHEEGIGFGVLVKLYAIAEAAQEACPAEPTGDTPTGDATTSDEPACTPTTVADLVTEFQSGVGMGQLFKEYGKPALLGVGHVKKALKEHQDTSDQETIGTDTTTDPGIEPGSNTTLDQKGHKPLKNGKNGKGKH